MPPITTPFKVAVVQDSPVFLNLGRSIGKACSLIQKAAGQGAKLVAFPETWLPGYPVWLDFAPGSGLWDYPSAKALFTILFENSVAIPSDETRVLAKAAKATKCAVVIGVHERRGSTLYNTIVYFSEKGELAGLHRKLVPTYSERLIWGGGDGSTLTVVNTPFGRVGGLVCWEHWMPLARAAMHAKQEHIHIAQWPMVKEMNLVASRQYAFEGQCFVLAVGCVLRQGELFEGLNEKDESAQEARQLLEEVPGGNAELILRGGSAIISPSGDFLAGPLEDEAGILTAEIDLSQIVQGKMALDVTGHYARPDIFQLHVNEKPLVDVSFKT